MTAQARCVWPGRKRSKTCFVVAWLNFVFSWKFSSFILKLYTEIHFKPYQLLMRYMLSKYEPWHDKTNEVSVRPAKTQISLGIRPVWSESSLSAWRNHGSLATHWVHSEDSDQTGRMPRLIWVFAGHTVTLLVLSCRVSYFFVAF